MLPAAHDLRASLWVLAALSLALVAPLPLLALGPVLLGVPHLVGDVRTLLLKTGALRRRALVLLAGPPLFLAWAFPTLRAGLLTAACAVLVARGSTVRRAAIVGACALGGLAAWQAGPLVDTGFAHLHNLVALALWVAVLPRGARTPWLTLALFTGGAALLWFRGWTAADEALGLDLDRLRWALAPGLDDDPAARLVLLYGYAQAVHYAVWIRLVPGATTEIVPPAPLAGRLRHWVSGLRASLTLPGLVVVVLLMLAFAGWALFDVPAARDGYLKLAGFHAHLELACVALWLAEGRPTFVPAAAA